MAKRVGVISKDFFVAAPQVDDVAVATAYPPRSAVVGWIFFDWAAQPYFTLITTFVFAPYFATHVAPDAATGQALWGFATAAAGMATLVLFFATGLVLLARVEK